MSDNFIPHPIETLPSSGTPPTPSASGHEPLYVHLAISDPEVILAASEYPEGRPRTDFIQTALKIGVLSLRAARGVVDGDTIQRSGDALLLQLNERLDGWRQNMEQNLTGSLSHYFDPRQGMFAERVERLVRDDGDIANVMKVQVQAAQLALSSVFQNFIGENSQLFQMLDPSGENKLLATMEKTIDGVIQAQNASILGQFSLDAPDSALSRLVRELTSKHGDLNEALSRRMGDVVAEFSLDKEDSALSRLVGRVDAAQKSLTREFSLDNEQSAISRLRGEMAQHHQKQMEVTNQFMERVNVLLTSVQVRKDEAARSTRHGHEFEASVGAVVRALIEEAGDVVQDCGMTTGLIAHSKVGDFLVTLGPDNVAAGAKIVVEAKESGSYDLAKTLAEAETARRNRQAAICVFVHSEKTATAGIPAFARYGHDIVLRWDADNEASDLWVKAALMVAKAMSVRAAAHDKGEAASFATIDKAIEAIRKQIEGFDEIATFANTSAKASQKILDRAEIMKTQITQCMGTLGEQVEKLKASGDE
ncbi:MAG TPA: hypothetical protein VLJ58_01645 [Ramlibacter sp.]|nr:hypothetical protein [Ramlibacter sp.]